MIDLLFRKFSGLKLRYHNRTLVAELKSFLPPCTMNSIEQLRYMLEVNAELLNKDEWMTKEDDLA